MQGLYILKCTLYLKHCSPLEQKGIVDRPQVGQGLSLLIEPLMILFLNYESPFIPVATKSCKIYFVLGDSLHIASFLKFFIFFLEYHHPKI